MLSDAEKNYILREAKALHITVVVEGQEDVRYGTGRLEFRHGRPKLVRRDTTYRVVLKSVYGARNRQERRIETVGQWRMYLAERNCGR